MKADFSIEVAVRGWWPTYFTLPYYQCVWIMLKVVARQGHNYQEV